MDLHDKTKEELIKELKELQQAHNALKTSAEADIISQKQTMEALQASEERFQLLFNKAPLGYQSLDFDGNFIEVNQQWLDTLGYKREEVIGKWFGDFLTPAFKDGFRKRFPIFKERGKIHSEFEMIHKNGSVLFIAFDGRIGYDVKGDFKQTHCILQDITSIKQAEKDLIKSRELLNTMEKAAKIGGWEFDVETNKQTWTEEIFHILEIDTTHGAPDVPEGIGFIAPEFQPMALLGIQRAIEFGEPYNQEWEVITAKGNKRWINAIATPYQENGKTKSVSGSFQDITKRKLTEIALLESEENLSTTLHSIGDAVISTDKNGRIIQMNPVAETLCGWKLTEALGKPLAEVFTIINAETRQPVADPVKKVLEKGEIVGLANHTVLISKNGTEYQIADSAAPIKNKDGVITGVVLVFSDVTEKDAAQKQIKESEARYRYLLNNLEAGIVVHAPDTSIVMNNSRASEILGLSDDQLRGKVAIDPAWKFIHEDNTPLTLDEYPVNRIVTSRQPIKNQLLGRHQTNKNNIVWATVNGFPVFDKTGEITEIVISFIEITERKLAELLLQEKTEEIEAQNEEYQVINEELNETNQQLQKAKEKAEDSKERFELAMKASNDGLFDWNLETNEIYYSPGWKKMLGYKDHEIPNDFSVWENTTEPEHVKKSWEMQQQLISKQIDRFVLEFKMKHKDGHWVDILSRAEAIFNDSGKAVRIVGTHTDISERKRAEEKEKELLKRFELISLHLPGVIYQFRLRNDGSFHFPYASPGISNIYGVLPKDVEHDASTAFKAIYPEDLEQVSASIYHSAETLTPWHDIYRVNQPSGKTIWVEGNSTPQKLNDGSIIWHGFIQDITERKQAEENSTRISRIMQNSQEIAHLGSFEYIAVNHTTIWSEEEYRIYGLDSKSPSPEYNVMLEKCIHPDDAKLLHDTFVTAIQNSEIYELEHRIVRPDGSIRWVYDKAHPYFDEHGILLRYVGATLDITDRKLAEEELKSVKASLELCLEASQIGIWSHNLIEDPEHIKEVSVRDLKHDQIFGYKEKLASWGQEKMLEHVIDEDREATRKAFDSIFEKGRLDFECRILWPDNTIHWIACRGKVYNDSAGQPNQINGTVMDITERKLAEQELIIAKEHAEESEKNLLKTNEEFRRSNQLLDESQSISKVGGWEFDIINNKLYWTAETYRIHDTSPQEFNPTVNAGVSYFLPESKRLISEALELAMKQGTGYDLILETYTTKGRRIDVRTTCQVTLVDGKPVKLTGIFQDITERLLEEEKLRKSEEQNKAIVLSTPDHIIMQDKDLKYTFVVNPQMGLTEQDMLGKTDYDFLTKENADNLTLAKTRVIETGEPLHFETSLISATGKEEFFDGTYIPTFDNHVQVNGLIGYFRNVTERKQMEESLRKSEEKAASILENSIDVIWSLKWPDMDILFMSPSIEVVYERSVQEFYDDPSLWQKIIHADDKHCVDETFEKLQKDGFATRECRIVTPDGKVKWVSDKSKLIVDKNGSPIRIDGVAVDVTKRKQAEEALQKSEAIKNKMVSNIGDVIVIIDKEGINRYKSPNIEKLFGWKPEDLVGNSTWDNVHPEDLEGGQKFILSLAGEPNKSGTTELRYRKKDGSYCPIEITVSNLLQDPNIQGFLGNYRDISERKQAEQELVTAKNQAEESDRLKSAFLANMSHEIRTPMNGILGFAELLKEPDLTGEQQQEYIAIIEKSGNRMLNIINDIVDISKIEAGLMKTDFKETNINEQIEYIYTFFRPEVESKGISFAFRNALPAKEAILKTDREKVYSILMNLVKNAIKYTKKGSIEFGYDMVVETGHVVETRQALSLPQKSFLQFYVKDTGIGIRADRQSAIFERFIQADISDKMARQGAGLGLAIAKSYIEMLGGKIWVESEAGIGSTFYFTLPYHANTTEDADIQKLANTDTTDQFVKLKILIAEDDEISELLLEKTVKIVGKEILKARTGTEAIESCRQNPDIDLVLMDIRMPELGGYESTRQIREFNKDVVIIAQTAYGLSGDREKAIEAGCNDYIAKPINKDKLQALIQKYFKK